MFLKTSLNRLRHLWRKGREGSRRLCYNIKCIPRDCHEVTLSDMKVSGVVLFNGRLSGLGNMTRWGNTTLEMKYEQYWDTDILMLIHNSRSDCVFLNCTLLLKDLHVIFCWKRRKLKYVVCTFCILPICFWRIIIYRGEIAGRINRAFLTLKMKQKVRATSCQPALEG